MKLVVYLMRKFLPLFLGSILFFSLVLILVDLLMNLWSYISNAVPPAIVFKIMILYLPKTLWYAAPLAILFATSYTLSDFYANNELTAVFASGVPLAIFSLPLLFFSVILSLAVLFFEDLVVVPTFAQKTALQEKSLSREKSKNNDNIVIIGDFGNVIYKADFYDDSLSRLYTLYLIFREPETKELTAIVRADSAQWHESKWILSNPIQYTYEKSQKNLVIQKFDPILNERLTEPPETFRNNTVNVETVSIKQASQYVEHLKRTGLPFAEAQSVYYKKFSFPFIIFIVVFLSVGLSGKTRKNVLLTSLASCISAAVLFYVTQMITMLMAKFGFMSPFLGAWSPVFLFVVISAILVRFART